MQLTLGALVLIFCFILFHFLEEGVLFCDLKLSAFGRMI